MHYVVLYSRWSLTTFYTIRPSLWFILYFSRILLAFLNIELYWISSHGEYFYNNSHIYLKLIACCRILIFFYYGFCKICYTILFELKFSCVLAKQIEEKAASSQPSVLLHTLNLLSTIIFKKSILFSHSYTYWADLLLIKTKLVQSIWKRAFD